MSWRAVIAAGVLGCGHVEVTDVLCAWQHDVAAFEREVGKGRKQTGPQVELEAVDLAASGWSTCAVDRSQRLWCWGHFGGAARTRPLQVDLGIGVRAIDGGDDGYCAVLVDGSLSCFEPGFGSEQRSSFARPVTEVVMAGWRSQLVRLDDGSYVCQQFDRPCRVPEDKKHRPVLADGESVCLSHGSASKQLGDCHGSYPEVGRVVVLGARPRVCGDSWRWPDGCDAQVVARASTEQDGCELRADGVVRCAGNYARRRAQVTGASPLPHFDPYVVVPLPEPAVDIVAGSEHLCALGRSGRVACWGSNGAGQVGPGPIGEEVPASTVMGLHDVIRIDGHAGTFCAVDRAGGLWCWGDVPTAGHPTRMCGSEVATPTLVARVRRPEAIHELEVGDQAVCVRREGDDIECFGGWKHPRRQTFPESYGVVFRGEGRILDIALDERLCALRGSVAVCVDDAPSCGENCRDVEWLKGQMLEIDGRCAHDGASTISCWVYSAPAVSRVPGRIAEMRAHDGRWCARIVDGSVHCGRRDGKEVVVRQIPTSGVVDIAVGRDRGCVVLADGTAACWKPEDADPERKDVPYTVEGVEGAVQVAVADVAACALRGDGTVVCWGSERQGELGRGYLAYALDPLTIVLEERRE